MGLMTRRGKTHLSPPLFPSLWQYLRGARAAGLTGTRPTLLFVEDHTHPSGLGSAIYVQLLPGLGQGSWILGCCSWCKLPGIPFSQDPRKTGKPAPPGLWGPRDFYRRVSPLETLLPQRNKEGNGAWRDQGWHPLPVGTSQTLTPSSQAQEIILGRSPKVPE